jgi:LysR family hydrogen peroxide-inducible transcriptional activator
MTLTELKYLVTLAQEMHFGRAAEKCFVSQPTLSVAVKKLEDELGVTLFERHKGNITVTDLGQRLVQQAGAILEQTHVFKDIADSGKDQLNTPLKVGAIYTIGPYLFPYLIPETINHSNDMPLYIEENYTSVLRQRLKDCSLDAIIVALPFNEPDVVTMPLYDEPFMVVLPKGHALAEETEIDGSMLADTNLLLLGPGHCFRDQILDQYEELRELVSQATQTKEASRLVTEGSSLDTIRHMVASGLGVSILPMSALMDGFYDKQMIEVRPFKAPVPLRTVALAWRISFTRPKAIDIIASSAKACGKSLALTSNPADPKAEHH